MRKQYNFHKDGVDTLIWDVDNLIKLTQNFSVIEVPIEKITEFDMEYWFGNSSASATCREIANHTKLINECSLDYPIILSESGRVMDGMHRVCKAYIENKETLKSVQFKTDPEPDYKNVDEDDLSYD